MRYKVPTNTNGKMTQEVYVAHILEPIVSKWCENKEEEWVLEEDNDSGYRVKDNGNVVEQ